MYDIFFMVLIFLAIVRLLAHISPIPGPPETKTSSAKKVHDSPGVVGESEYEAIIGRPPTGVPAAQSSPEDNRSAK